MKTLLLLDIDEVRRLKKNAKLNPVPFEEMQKLSKGQPSPIPGGPDNLNNFTINAVNYEIIYTHECQPDGICRHLSISMFNEELPHIDVLQFICKEFGFINKVSDMPVWVEDFGDDTYKAVNVLEPIDGDFSKHMKKGK